MNNTFLMCDIYLKVKDKSDKTCMIIDAKQTERDKEITKKFLIANSSLVDKK
jgi:hypothetical protein